MINMSEYAKRRKALMKQIGTQGIVILPAAPTVLRNNDAAYPFRQNSDFYYLTGFEEPDAVLVLIPNRKEGEYILFTHVRDKESEIWDGPRAGLEGACKDFDADCAYPINEFALLLPELLANKEAIHYPLGINREFDKILLHGVNKIRGRIRGGTQAPIAFIDIMPSLHEMRLFKSPAEITVMRKAVDISAKAHIAAMQACRPGMYEYELEAAIMYEFIRHGARYSAYGTIVGAGKNSCVLHYVANNQKMTDGDLVLIDAGAEYQNYAADITRAFPVNGRFSGEQRVIYELVLAAQLAAINTIKPGTLWTAAQSVIVKVLTQGLVDLKILKGNVDGLIEKQAYLPFYMHRSGHWLGLDVHDVGCYQIGGKWRPLQNGMVLTVEPGLYINEPSDVDKRWHHIGVRIEDDVLVTEKGHLVMSEAIPKTVADVEAIMTKKDHE